MADVLTEIQTEHFPIANTEPIGPVVLLLISDNTCSEGGEHRHYCVWLRVVWCNITEDSYDPVVPIFRVNFRNAGRNYQTTWHHSLTSERQGFANFCPKTRLCLEGRVSTVSSPKLIKGFWLIFALFITASRILFTVFPNTLSLTFCPGRNRDNNGRDGRGIEVRFPAGQDTCSSH
jgi:hypothetical protein